jgi:hypothetical protein
MFYSEINLCDMWSDEAQCHVVPSNEGNHKRRETMREEESWRIDVGSLATISLCEWTWKERGEIY